MTPDKKATWIFQTNPKNYDINGLLDTKHARPWLAIAP